MNNFYQAEFKELFIEFTRYLTEHPEFVAYIPKDAEVILLDSKDPDYSLEAIKNAKTNRQTISLIDPLFISKSEKWLQSSRAYEK